MRRVVVTGIGAVSALGVGANANWEAAIAGRSGVGPITAFDVSAYSTRFGAYLNDWDPTPWLDTKEARRMARFQQFAVVAADEALKDSGLVIDETNAERVGVIVGSGIGGLGTMEEQHTILMERGPSRVSPFLVPMMIVDLAAGHISIRSGAKGINFAPVSACATGNHSLGEAAEAIRRGHADANHRGRLRLRHHAARPCRIRRRTRSFHPQRRPRRRVTAFDSGRDGFVMGEGRRRSWCLRRWKCQGSGAHIYAELAGTARPPDAIT